MPIDPNTGLPVTATSNDGSYTPDFVTPNQIAAQRAYSKAMLEHSFSTPTGTSGNVTAVSPWGGAAQMMQALAGNYGMKQAGQNELQLLNSGARAASYLPIPGQPWAQGASAAPYLNGAQSAAPMDSAMTALFSQPPS